jgi:glycosyltransferase involved in cell wall biosynthesis
MDPNAEIQFSVIVPARNEERMIGRCLERLAAMNYPRDKFEVILVDNGSTDRTLEVFQSWADRLHVRVLQRPNVKISALRNLGAAEAKGDGLAFLDADCLVPPEWLRDAGRFLVNENEGIVGAHYRIPPDSTWLARSWFDDEHANTAGDTSYVPAGDVLLRKSTFVRIGGFDEKLETNEDYEFCRRARRLGIPLRSYPSLEVIHLGTPQKIAKFYRQQRWHGRHVFKVFVENLPSLYNARAIFFAIYTLLSILGLVAGLGGSIVTGRPVWILGAVGFLLLGPVLLAARSALKRRKLGIFLPLILLYFLYGVARASCLLPQMAINQWKSVPVPNQ